MRVRVLKYVVVAGIALLALSGCSSGSGEEQIDDFAINYTIAPDSTVHVKETIKYDFGDTSDRHGIDRFLASRFETTTAGTDRVYSYDNVKVTSPTGASALFSTALLNYLQIRVGNKNANTSGKQTYVLSYDIHGALNRAKQDDGSYLDEFYWNATGDQWQIPIDKTEITVSGPGPISRIACFAGATGSDADCADSSKEATSATFSNGALYAGEGVTIDAGFADGTFANTEPILKPSLPADAVAVMSTGLRALVRMVFAAPTGTPSGGV